VISRNSITGEYPTKRLEDVVEFLDSMRRPVTESDRRAGQFPYYGANGLQGTIDNFIFDEPLVLLAEDGGHFSSPDRGIAYRVSGKTWVNNHAHVLRPKPGIDLAFLCRVLENYDVTPWVTGTTRGKLTQAGASEIVVPVPPFSEQRRIAEILDKADALRAKRRATLAQLDTLTRSTFLDMFGDPRANPRQWPKCALGDLLQIEWGNTSITKESYVPQGIPAYSASGCDGFLAHAEHTGEGIVLSAIGARCGKCFYVPGGSWTSIKNTITMRPKEKSKVELRYVLQLVDDETFWPNRGAGQPFIALGTARSQQIAVPLLEFQREFGRRASAIDRLKSDHRAALTGCDTLFTSLQHRAFRGEL
jgi:restriction endonuclease S subunit